MIECTNAMNSKFTVAMNDTFQIIQKISSQMQIHEPFGGGVR